MAASSPGTYAKKYGKENHPKNITLVNDELPLRVGAQSYHQVGEKHSELIVMAQPVELLPEWVQKMPVKLEKKHFEPITMALSVEGTQQQCSRVIPNP